MVSTKSENMAMTATWTKIGHAQSLQRSSHCITVVGANLYVVGGELQPRCKAYQLYFNRAPECVAEGHFAVS